MSAPLMVHLFPLRIELMYEQREMAELGVKLS